MIVYLANTNAKLPHSSEHFVNSNSLIPNNAGGRYYSCSLFIDKGSQVERGGGHKITPVITGCAKNSPPKDSPNPWGL